MTTQTEIMTHHVVTMSYDAASDAAHAAWAGVYVTGGASIAAGLLSAALVFATFYIPAQQRQARLRSALVSIGYSLALVGYFHEYINQIDNEEEVLLQEGLDKTETAVLSIDNMFATAPDDAELMRFALNLQTALRAFRAWVRYRKSGGPLAPAGQIAQQFNLPFSNLTAKYDEFDGLRRRFRAPDFAEIAARMGADR